MEIGNRKEERGERMSGERDREDYEIIREPGEYVSDEDDRRPELELSRQERRWYALGALKSALLIGGVYVIGLAVIIGLMLLFWL